MSGDGRLLICKADGLRANAKNDDFAEACRTARRLQDHLGVWTIDEANGESISLDRSNFSRQEVRLADKPGDKFIGRLFVNIARVAFLDHLSLFDYSDSGRHG